MKELNWKTMYFVNHQSYLPIISLREPSIRKEALDKKNVVKRRSNSRGKCDNWYVDIRESGDDRGRSSCYKRCSRLCIDGRSTGKTNWMGL